MARPPKQKKDPSQTSGEPFIMDDFKSFLYEEGIEEVQDNSLVLPTGIDLLDTILGGGFKMHLSMLVGHSGGGKTALALQVIKAGQSVPEWKGKFITVYVDTENSVDNDRLLALGIDPNYVQFPDVYTVEGVFKCIEKVCAFKEKNKHLMEIPTLFIWDSIANTQTDSMDASDERNNMMQAQRAGVISYYLPKYTRKCKKYNICFLSINQYRDDVNVDIYSKKKTLKYLKKGNIIPGGKSLIYNTFHIVDVSAGQELVNKDGENTYGFTCSKTEVYAIKNKKFKPNVNIDLIYGFDTGFTNSNLWTNFEMLKEYKYITAGAWTYLRDMPEIKFRQKEIENIYNDNPEFKKSFDSAVAECLKEQYVDRYKGYVYKDEEEDEETETPVENVSQEFQSINFGEE